uniref:Uncharacterized protein n=1 Tax=Neobodo designis TaxID=312471 RepID=A0A7S1LTP7_NEODS|mmetsp:Transcript_28035/g.86865  ORF Transcript_28035/g.86865 Transcript_28035/m.86865 type:complete len:127 (+) Transcript_28035:166-546(+)|eukprot:CAMPEP_0174839994 /NCGR_PEP_ID=MMETSP1114-20130205/8403_1 /TAXON_ID=312471 /ORGANISM="Neobodo designis, Strain CCAP 1951/1" /LENGTH=126 /DNA_ID=CAMNT_0016074123 /DNA_START=161 /DNA_END=541 /DNA_ORIENTATION=+
MMRRVAAMAPKARAPATTSAALVMTGAGTQLQKREFSGVFDIFLSLTFLSMTMTCWACWANNALNVWKFGAYRFKYMVDDTILPLDFKAARYAGGIFGFFFWWFLVAPKKYERSSIEEWTTRVGPF